MSRASQAKPATNSTKVPSKPLTSWKDRINQEDYDELKNTFDVFDEDGSGTIDPVQINKVLEELGLDRRNPFILGMINSLKDQNKPIKFEEFLSLMCEKVGETRTKDGLRRVYAIFDKNEDGVIDFQEFKTLLRQMKEGMNDDDILEMMHSTFINKKTSSNEAFTFDEFYLIVSTFANK